jgi:6-phosphogluconolactonase
VNISRSNKWAVVADLGIDEFIVYKLDAAAGRLERHSAAKVRGGSGPRHFHFHPGNRFAYGLNEMASAVSVFKWDDTRGELTEIQTISTLPQDFAGQSSCAEILVHPTGKFVYASNRGHDSLAIFAVDAAKGTLTPAGHASTLGKTPRNFRIDPTGGYVVCGNQNTNNIVVFKLDQATGALTPTGQDLKLPAPVCFRFV